MPLTWRRTIVGALSAVVAVAAAAALFVYIASERKLNATYPVRSDSIVIPADPASLSRGEHIVKAVGTCALCHGEDLGGAVYADMGLMGIIAGPNLTRGRGGAGAEFSVDDWVRAIRYGVRRDGTSLIAMPSEVFTNFSDEDLGAVIAYVRQVPPVDRDVPRTRFGFLGRALLATGRLNILVAPKTHHQPQPAPVIREPTAEYGRYLADVSGCHGCHGHGLSGGRVAGPPYLPPASNLTPAGIGAWTEADFVRAIREGRKPDNTALDEFMPWRTYARMQDAELHALWLYLRSVPPRPFGNK